MHTTDNIIAPRSHDPFAFPGRLGQPGEAPQNCEEAEARFLRGVRTDNHFERLERAVSGNSSDIPRCLRDKARAVEWEVVRNKGKHPKLNREELEEFYFDGSRLEAIGDRWRPTPRDVGDWEAGILRQWGMGLSRDKWKILRARAANPPWGFSEIDNRESKYRGWSWRNYRWAIDEIWARARG